MIHDAIVPVTCDKEGCIKDYWVNISSGVLIYIELKKADWIIINGKHYCTEECAREVENV